MPRSCSPHLNAKRPNNRAALFAGEPSIRTFEEYFDAFRYFGDHNYGPHSTGAHKSSFDHKQIRFLRPFNEIHFTDDTRDNLRRVVDEKLQLELIPYGSSDFSGTKFHAELLRPHFERIMRVMTARPRHYVIFCGAVFAKLLPAGSAVREHDFHLTKTDGSQTKNRFYFTELRVSWEGR